MNKSLAFYNNYYCGPFKEHLLAQMVLVDFLSH